MLVSHCHADPSTRHRRAMPRSGLRFAQAPRNLVGSMSRGYLSRAELERVVAEALDSLPERFARLVENVIVTVEEEPTEEDLEEFDGDADDNSELLGIYRGVALTERTHDDPILPDEIAIFRGPINRATSTWDEAVDEVRETVIHELGHYFGLADEEMPQ
jgi:predicted Zn-dependent protease with MMP-like domain